MLHFRVLIRYKTNGQTGRLLLQSPHPTIKHIMKQHDTALEKM